MNKQYQQHILEKLQTSIPSVFVYTDMKEKKLAIIVTQNHSLFLTLTENDNPATSAKYVN